MSFIICNDASTGGLGTAGKDWEWIRKAMQETLGGHDAAVCWNNCLLKCCYMATPWVSGRRAYPCSAAGHSSTPSRGLGWGVLFSTCRNHLVSFLWRVHVWLPRDQGGHFSQEVRSLSPPTLPPPRFSSSVIKQPAHKKDHSPCFYLCCDHVFFLAVQPRRSHNALNL